jgi:predicted dehydrogenase
MPSRPITAALIGAGNRGYAAYGPYAMQHPDEILFVAVAEPIDARRVRFAQDHTIPPERRFRTWEDLLAQGQIADVVLVCTLDPAHIAPTLAALEVGYDVLLEKPMATTLTDCVRLVQAAERTGRLLQICHVLRYAPFFSTLHDVVTSGRLGDIIAVEHRENVVYWHMAHSYVRGNWRNSETESPIILAKCCHDLDILYWNLGPCVRLNSFGSLVHFRPENAPPGVPEYCTDDCPVADDCPWYAPRLYLDLIPLMHVARRSPDRLQRLGSTLALNYPSLVGAAWRRIPIVHRIFDYQGWPISTISDDSSRDSRLRALRAGPYGRCVYRCDNDVVDYQAVNMEFKCGAFGLLVMQGHSDEEIRSVRYDGTRATLHGEFAYGVGRTFIEIRDHMTGRTERIVPTASHGLHGGGDEGVMAAFVRAVRDPSAALTTARESLESHLMAFAAEEARLSGASVSMDRFRHQAESLD